jgi:hypothetical protein
MEDYLEIAYSPEIAERKNLEIPLTGDERIYYGKPVQNK